jgi:hypothetical protein
MCTCSSAFFDVLSLAFVAKAANYHGVSVFKVKLLVITHVDFHIIQVKAVQKHYSESSDPTSNGQAVNIGLHSATATPSGSAPTTGTGVGPGEQFVYFPKSTASAPYIRFSVPGKRQLFSVMQF